MACDKFDEYMRIQIPKELAILKAEAADKKDILLLENYVHNHVSYYSGSEYHLRVDFEDVQEKLEQFLEKFKQSFKIFYAYHEVSNKEKKPHYHMHIIFNDKVKIDSIRKAYNRFWDRKGTELTLTNDKGLSRIYTTKDRKRKISYGISEDLLRTYELVAKQKVSDQPKEDRKKRKENEGNPMEIMLEAFKAKAQYKLDKYNTEHIDKREISYYYTDRDIGIFVMEWYAKHLKKSFMLNKMSECLMFIRYHVNNFSEDNPDELTLTKLLEKTFN